MNTENENRWIISFSDLLFLLVAFFVWRQQFLVEEETVGEYGEVAVEKSSTVKSDNSLSMLPPGSRKQENSLSVSVFPSWFSEEGELTIFGGMQLEAFQEGLHAGARGILFEVYLPEYASREEPVYMERIQEISKYLGSSEAFEQQVSLQIGEEKRQEIVKLSMLF